MRISFPPVHQLRATCRETGFVARSALHHGERRPELELDRLNKRHVLTQDLGYIAGTAVHVNLGLEHCTQVVLFDPAKKIGASSHLEAVHYTDALARKVPTRQDILRDITDMVETLGLLGANPHKLTGYCVFGVGSGLPADLPWVIRVLNGLGIKLPAVAPCFNPDDAYRADLLRGLVTLSAAEDPKPVTLFQTAARQTDLTPRVLAVFQQAEAYHQRICGVFGKEEFAEYTIPRLAAIHFAQPYILLAELKKAVKQGADLSPTKIGPFLREYGLARSGPAAE